MRMSEGFVYLWKDTKRNKFYLGSHFGSLDDGYAGSNNRFICAFKSRPETFKRRILEHHISITSKDLLKKEESWLQLIKVEELATKYYNEKRVAAGGDIISGLSEEKRKQHREKSSVGAKKYWDNITPEELEHRKSTAFGGNKFDRSYMQTNEFKHKLSVATSGEKNGFYKKTHSDEHKHFISNRNGEQKWRQKQYKVTFSNGVIEYYYGIDSIAEKYCSTYPLKFTRFIDTGIPVTSKRHAAKNNLLYGALIEVVVK